MEAAYMRIPLAPCKNTSISDQRLTSLLQNLTSRRDPQLKPIDPFSFIASTAVGLASRTSRLSVVGNG
eukprot:6991971-Karenia_brevis.AAC.1